MQRVARIHNTSAALVRAYKGMRRQIDTRRKMVAHARLLFLRAKVWAEIALNMVTKP